MEAITELLKDERVLLGLTAAAVVLLVKVWLSPKTKRPPGPRVWPVVGTLPYMKDDIIMFTEWAEQYGDIYFLQLGLFGRNPTIVLNNMDLLREALLKKQDDFAGRIRTPNFDLFSENGSDIVFGDFDDTWRYMRKVVHTALRKYASGNQFQDLLERNVEMLSEIFKKQDGKPTDIFKPASLLFYNIISTVCYGKKYDLDDPEFNKIRTMINEVNDLFNGFFLSDLLPIFKHIPTPATNTLKKSARDLIEFINGYVSDHRKNFSDDDVRDLTDYVIHIEREMKATGLEQYQVNLTDVHIRQIVFNMFFAGTDTSRITLTWALMFMASHPEIQEKAQKEIDDRLGREGKITGTSRMKIPYCEAIIFETLRLRSPAPLAVPHATTCDTSAGGYSLPKGTQVFINLARIHTDPREWDNPEEFRPERFIDQYGNLAAKPNAFLPFSTGRRQCVGEAFAKSELHILFGMLLQRFKFSLPPGKKISLIPKRNIFVYLPRDDETQLIIKER